MDVTDYLQFQNKQLQARNKLVTEIYDSNRAYMLKLQLFENQFAARDTFHFAALKTFHDKDDCIVSEKYCQKIKAVVDTFDEKIADFKDLETDFAISRSPFSVNAEEVQQKY